MPIDDTPIARDGGQRYNIRRTEQLQRNHGPLRADGGYMNQWYPIEFLCPVCRVWSATGGATTAENFHAAGPIGAGGRRLGLPCGHTVMSNHLEARLGAEISRPSVVPLAS